MDPLTKYLVYNKTPTTRHPMDYDTIKAQKKDVKEKGAAIDRRVLLLSPDIEKVYEGEFEVIKVLNLRMNGFNLFYCRRKRNFKVDSIEK